MPLSESLRRTDNLRLKTVQLGLKILHRNRAASFFFEVCRGRKLLHPRAGFVGSESGDADGLLLGFLLYGLGFFNRCGFFFFGLLLAASDGERGEQQD
jgi:hypothetical protein